MQTSYRRRRTNKPDNKHIVVFCRRGGIAFLSAVVYIWDVEKKKRTFTYSDVKMIKEEVRNLTDEVKKVRKHYRDEPTYIKTNENDLRLTKKFEEFIVKKYRQETPLPMRVVDFFAEGENAPADTYREFMQNVAREIAEYRNLINRTASLMQEEGKDAVFVEK